MAIARALITRPDVIFADEPTGALDPHTAVGVLRLLRGAADGATVVVIVTGLAAGVAAGTVTLLAVTRAATGSMTP